ncbi:MAG: hypothetical protein RR048_00740 [Oscillospiraceae bacterium]
MGKFIKFLTSLVLLLGSVVLFFAIVEEKNKNCLVFDDSEDKEF